ncbi:Sec-independent protein translocase subunit TatA [Actinomyces naeslundii]|mgnify:FL=1|uniref:Sec-independent protein translocase protein TatA n=2 Tax=Actinomyces naeslundii TaxID=1655 RepID=J3F2X3_ACTNH|nr:Sec-independent protein translocase subunit TatA [Actinomyces naeslundii]EJN84782.1 twin arginine-targeting protein translocase, TatA/E family [Actinomyces naeslundii str. Howell 279]OMG21589.1 Sec-independent protein translocase TatA [Actinomyces naeslundii]OMG27959.1 Sec-independent protein translocase TatA [Actinomyces naeslundii]OMG29170.1 Sec-independent protein translocase TatA [Actinomyces naeslundii]OMG36579.1 Sec-independent protein translocase TatA [Actinomyces naeslundii]
MRFQVWHMIVLLVLVLVVFGSSRLPDIAKSVGQSMKVFKKEIKELRDEDDDKKPAAQIQQQPQEGTYYTEPTQSGQTAQSTEGSSQK